MRLARTSARLPVCRRRGTFAVTAAPRGIRKSLRVATTDACRETKQGATPSAGRPSSSPNLRTSGLRCPVTQACGRTSLSRAMGPVMRPVCRGRGHDPS